MTVEELANLTSRLAKAEQAMSRIARLTEAVEKLKDVSQLRLAVNGSLPAIQYATTASPDPSWLRVCWAELETGLADEVMQAIRDILQRRLATAKQQFDEQ